MNNLCENVEKQKIKINSLKKDIVHLKAENAFADRTIKKLKMAIGGSNISIRDFNIVTGIIDDYNKGKK